MKTTIELVKAIESITNILGYSVKAYEEKDIEVPNNFRRFIHSTYAIVGKDDASILDEMWEQIQAIVKYNDSDKPDTFWRMMPTIHDTDEYDRMEKGKRYLKMRLAIGSSGQDGGYVPWVSKPEGEPPAEMK